MTLQCHFALYLVILVELMIGAREAIAADCPTDMYLPCVCRVDDATGMYTVYCFDVSVNSITATFHKYPNVELFYVELYLDADVDTLPPNLIDTNKALQLRLKSRAPKLNNRLTVDIDAFAASRDFTTEIILSYWAFNNLDFRFLTKFSKLEKLTFNTVRGFGGSLATIPPLPSLRAIAFEFCRELDYLTVYPSLDHGLEEFYVVNSGLQDSDLHDGSLSRMLQSLLESSKDTLKYLRIVSNLMLTRIPPEVGMFTALSEFQITQNSYDPQILPSGIFNYSSSASAPEKMIMFYESIKQIEWGAFIGNFSNTFIDLHDNVLTALEWWTFGPVLEQMATGSGKIDLNGNPIDCDSDPCKLAWILRDRPDLLSPIAEGATCSNSVSLHSLINASILADCPLQNTDYSELPETTRMSTTTEVTTTDPMAEATKTTAATTERAGTTLVSNAQSESTTTKRVTTNTNATVTTTTQSPTSSGCSYDPNPFIFMSASFCFWHRRNF